MLHIIFPIERCSRNKTVLLANAASPLSGMMLRTGQTSRDSRLRSAAVVTEVNKHGVAVIDAVMSGAATPIDQWPHPETA